MIISICVGSSCHIKGSQKIVELMKNAVEENHLGDVVTLCGTFCQGHCDNPGVTVQIDDTTHTGVTPESFYDFFNNQILKPALAEREGF